MDLSLYKPKFIQPFLIWDTNVKCFTKFYSDIHVVLSILCKNPREIVKAKLLPLQLAFGCYGLDLFSDEISNNYRRIQHNRNENVNN